MAEICGIARERVCITVNGVKGNSRFILLGQSDAKQNHSVSELMEADELYHLAVHV